MNTHFLLSPTTYSINSGLIPFLPIQHTHDPIPIIPPYLCPFVWSPFFLHHHHAPISSLSFAHHTHTSILTLIFMPHACTHQTHSTLPPFLSLQTLSYPYRWSSRHVATFLSITSIFYLTLSSFIFIHYLPLHLFQTHYHLSKPDYSSNHPLHSLLSPSSKPIVLTFIHISSPLILNT